MTLAELTKKYNEFYVSNSVLDKYRAIGYLEILKDAKTLFPNEHSENIKVSFAAERYYKLNSDLYHSLHKEEYRQKAQAAKECIIEYISVDELNTAVSKWTNIGETWQSYISYLKDLGYYDRTSFANIKRAYDLMTLGGD